MGKLFEFGVKQHVLRDLNVFFGLNVLGKRLDHGGDFGVFACEFAVVIDVVGDIGLLEQMIDF